MYSIYHQVGIRATVPQIMEKLTTIDGISQWWSFASGSTEVGEPLIVDFDNAKITLKVKEQTETTVVWKCVEVHPEWEDTIVKFELKEKPEQTFVNFEHSGWDHVDGLLPHCNTKWAVFLLSLKDLLETGTGNPYPHDIQVNHS